MLEHVSVRQLSPVFVGREAECEVLTEQLAGARAGQPGVVLIGGEAGVGKTRLVEEFAATASAQGATVLLGGCFDLGDDALPFAPFSMALRRPMQTAGVADLVELAGGGSGDRRRLYEAVTDLIEQLGKDAPLVLVLEDLHWADNSTRELMAFLARTLHDTAVVVVGTYRSDELHRNHPLRPFVAELDRVRSVERIELPRLDREQVGVQLASLIDRIPSETEIDEVFRRSEGNPFFVEELSCCASAKSLPQSLRDLLLVRVERLSPATQQLLHTAAIIGVEVPYPLLAAVTDAANADTDAASDADAATDRTALLEALREAVESNLLVTRVDDDAYVFRHSLLRESLHNDLLPGEHTQLHARVAQVLTDQPSLIHPDRWPAEVAHHWNAAHDLPRALPAAYAAAETAGRTQAFAEQLRMLERVLALWEVVPNARELIDVDELSVTQKAADVARQAGEVDRGLALIDRSVELAEAGSDVDRLVVVLGQRGKWRCSSNRDQGTEDLRRALSLVPEDPPSELRAATLDALGSVLSLRGRLEEAETLTREALELARLLSNTAIEISALATLGTILVDTDDADVGLATSREALTLAEREGTKMPLARVLTNLSHVLTGVGRHQEAVDAARRGLVVISEMGLNRTFGPKLAGNVADPLLSLGRLDEAQVVVEEALRQTGSSREDSAYAEQLSGWLALLRGDVDQAAEIGERVAAQDPFSRLLPQDTLPIARLRAATGLAQGDPDTAYDVAVDQLRGDRVGGHVRYVWPLLTVAARAAADRAQRARDLQNEPAATAALADVLWVQGVAETLPIPGAAAVAWRAHLLAEVARARGEDDVEQWQEVARAYAKVEEPWPRGTALLRAAELAAHSGDRDAATELLRESDAAAAVIGPGLLKDAVDEFARRSRLKLSPADAAPPPEAVPSNSLGLTERERDVLRGLTRGESNKQIAEQLFMSPKTASVHVSNILAKLGVSSRGEAAALAHRLQLFPDD